MLYILSGITCRNFVTCGVVQGDVWSSVMSDRGQYYMH